MFPDPRIITVAMGFATRCKDLNVNENPTPEEIALRAANVPKEIADGYEAAIVSVEIAGKRVRVLVTGEPGTRAALGL